MHFEDDKKSNNYGSLGIVGYQFERDMVFIENYRNYNNNTNFSNLLS
jgi:hypothetical protein